MGEIADMMIGGEMCPCGEYLGDGAGFPQYCSKQCAKDYGGVDDNPKPAPTRPKDTISGIWLHIASAVADGAKTLPEVARALHKDDEAMSHTRNKVSTNMEKMTHAGLLHHDSAGVRLTKKAKRQLANSRPEGGKPDDGLDITY